MKISQPGYLAAISCEPPKPKLFCPYSHFFEMLTYSIESPGEIRGCGFVDQTRNLSTGGDEAALRSIMIPRQSVTGNDVLVTPMASIELMMRAREMGLDMNHKRFVWHSHVDGPVFWSPDDLRDINRTGGAQGGITEAPWLISLVINRSAEYLCRLDQFTPLRMTSEVELILVPSAEDSARVRQELGELLTCAGYKYNPKKGFVKTKPKPPPKKSIQQGADQYLCREGGETHVWPDKDQLP